MEGDGISTRVLEVDMRVSQIDSGCGDGDGVGFRERRLGSVTTGSAFAMLSDRVVLSESRNCW